MQQDCTLSRLPSCRKSRRHPVSRAHQPRVLSPSCNEVSAGNHGFPPIRAGRVAAAAALCREAGQPWRAASLSGGGGWGPTPLGPAAAAADAAAASGDLADELADQVTLILAKHPLLHHCTLTVVLHGIPPPGFPGRCAML